MRGEGSEEREEEGESVERVKLPDDGWEGKRGSEEEQGVAGGCLGSRGEEVEREGHRGVEDRGGESHHTLHHTLEEGKRKRGASVRKISWVESE